MLENNEPIDKIAKYTGYGIDKVKEIAEQMKTPLSVWYEKSPEHKLNGIKFWGFFHLADVYLSGP